jgi:4-oxalocrotonate tautomerase
MPFISVKLLSGRSHEQKKELAEVITDAMERICGAPRSGTMVVFDEYDKADWAVAGQLVSART